jgi:hypothetical protein
LIAYSRLSGVSWTCWESLLETDDTEEIELATLDFLGRVRVSNPS